MTLDEIDAALEALHQELVDPTDLPDAPVIKAEMDRLLEQRLTLTRHPRRADGRAVRHG
jgi:hypothetical protein